jgi:hypothetical protein
MTPPVRREVAPPRDDGAVARRAEIRQRRCERTVPAELHRDEKRRDDAEEKDE